jgi:hypothetical protein
LIFALFSPYQHAVALHSTTTRMLRGYSVSVNQRLRPVRGQSYGGTR